MHHPKGINYVFYVHYVVQKVNHNRYIEQIRDIIEYFYLSKNSKTAFMNSSGCSAWIQCPAFSMVIKEESGN